MIKIFKSIENQLMQEMSEIVEKSWIDLVNPTDDEVAQVSTVTGISEEMIKAALDEEETARSEVDDGNTIFIVDIPVLEENDDWFVYTTLPMSVIYNTKYIVTVSLKENSIIKDLISGRVKDNNTTDRPVKFLLNFLYKNASKFLQYLKQIDKTSHRVQAELHRSMKNKELIQLLDLENSLVYFSTSLNANEKMFEKIDKIEQVHKNEDYQDLFEDVIIENRQAIEMCNIYRDILSGTMDAFASVISNNVNIVMKMLTIITIIITIPTLIASVWGMNVPVPFQNYKYGFYVVLGIAVFFSIVGATILIKNTNSIKYGKRRKK
jgi:magnesium transporter